MSGSQARLDAIQAVKHYRPPSEPLGEGQRPGEVFGQNVFGRVQHGAHQQGLGKRAGTHQGVGLTGRYLARCLQHGDRGQVSGGIHGHTRRGSVWRHVQTP